jgi:iron complex transport system ATP-binding protein
MIEVKQITKSYGDKMVLDELSMAIPKGKITSLIGPNGAGKSTLLSIISRLIDQQEGSVLLNAQNIASYKSRALAQQLSILKQSNHLDLKLTVEELVSFGRFPYTQGNLNAEDRQKIDEAIEFLNLESIRHSFIDELSGGQKQRAFLAMVVAQDTEYILLDEPLNNLDMKHAVNIMKTLRRLTDELGKTIIIVIHEINFASCYSDYIAALKNGRVLYFDEVGKVIQPDILKEVFDIEFNIQPVNGKRICNYFNL